ncbi:MAG: BspA family leucine-rich repeat surface protein [Bacilli bacterium]|nr:BspA family leucine-rich repeat surface protein [Bacilli bacterium]
MNKTTKKYMLYTVSGIILLLVSITAVTYSFLKTEVIQEEANVLTTLDCMEVAITGVSDELNLANSYPITDEQGTNTVPYTFKVVNKCQTYVEYKIIMSLMDTSTLTDENYIKVSLNGPKNLKASTLDNLEKETSTMEIENTIHNYVLLKGHFENMEEHTYDYRMWLNSNNENIWTDESIANKNINVKLSIIAVTTYKPVQLKEILSYEEANTPFLNGPINKDQIENIDFSTSKEISTTAIESWDVSNDNNNSIIAWYESTGVDGRYKVTIGQNAGVIANENSSYLFSNLPYLKILNLNNFDTRFVSNMSNMFINIGSLSSTIEIIGLENFDTSGVTDMSNMFNSFGQNKNDLYLDLSSWDTSNVLNTSYMFNKVNLDSLNLSLWNINKITNMDNMFDSAIFQILRLDNWDTPTSTKNLMFNNISLTSEIYAKNEELKNWIMTETNLPEGIMVISLT